MKTINSVLQDAANTLYTAELGLEMYNSSIHRQRLAGLRNIIVFGRSVTFAIQNLKNLVGKNFNEWYGNKVTEMKNDPIFSYLNTVRTEIIHEGKMNLIASATLNGDPTAMMRKIPQPPRAKAWFLGDPNLGSGWIVETEDGKTEDFLIDIPDKTEDFEMEITLHFAEAPTDLQGADILPMLEHYLTYLGDLVKEATKIFKE